MSCESKDFDFQIEQGVTWLRSLVIKSGPTTPINLTGYTFRGQIRKSYSYPSIVVSFTFTIIDALNGKVNVSLTDTQTSAIPVNPAYNPERPFTEYIYDIEWISAGGIVERLMQGQALISPEVTK